MFVPLDQMTSGVNIEFKPNVSYAPFSFARSPIDFSEISVGDAQISNATTEGAPEFPVYMKATVDITRITEHENTITFALGLYFVWRPNVEDPEKDDPEKDDPELFKQESCTPVLEEKQSENHTTKPGKRDPGVAKLKLDDNWAKTMPVRYKSFHKKNSLSHLQQETRESDHFKVIERPSWVPEVSRFQAIVSSEEPPKYETIFYEAVNEMEGEQTFFVHACRYSIVDLDVHNTLELYRFPFDRQLVQVVFSS